MAWRTNSMLTRPAEHSALAPLSDGFRRGWNSAQGIGSFDPGRTPPTPDMQVKLNLKIKYRGPFAHSLRRFSRKLLRHISISG